MNVQRDPMVMNKEGKCHSCCVKSMSWSAVIAGALVAIGVAFLLNLFSVAIGLSAFTLNKAGFVSLTVGGFIGLVISAAVAMFLGGWVAGYLGRYAAHKRDIGILYGFLSWSLALILTVFMASSIGKYVSSYSDFVRNPTIVHVTTNEEAPMAVVKSMTTSMSPTHHMTEMTVNAEKATNNLGTVAMVVFLLFGIGAFASCIGGHYGINSRDRADLNPHSDPMSRF